MGFLAGLVPGLSMLTNPVVLIALAIMAASCFTAGWKVESWRWDASLKATADDNLKRVQKYFDDQRKNNEKVTAGINADRVALESDRTKFQEQYDAARRNGPILKSQCKPNPIPQRPGGAPGGASAVAEASPGGAAASDAGAAGVVCDAACMRLWNDGLAQGLPSAYAGWRANAAGAATDTVEGDALIGNAGANAARCNAIRSVAIGWQRKACLEGWWTGPECVALR